MSLEDADGADATAYMRALAHPVRLRMLSLLTPSPRSAAELARELGGTHANASYHLRTLLQAGLVVLAEERSVRGGRERRYAVAPARALMADATPEAQSQYAAALGEELRRRWPDRAPELPRAHADAELWVEPPVWDEVVAHVRAGLDLLHERAQPAGTPGTVRTSTTVALFGMQER